VQVRNVEFYINGALVAVDGNFPYEHRFITPRRTGPGSVFTVRGVAFDTGGNKSETPTLSVELVPDATPPKVVGESPERGQIVGTTDAITVFFSEPIDPGTLNPGTFDLRSAGADGVFGTADDSMVAAASIEYRAPIQAAFLRVPARLGPGSHRATIRPPLADLAGNPLASAVSWDFLVIGSEDADSDGVPDNVEGLLGLDPKNPDSDGDGIRDGDEDPDQDGLTTSWELAFGLDPRSKDTNDNGILDPDEDADRDGLTNALEQMARTSPLRFDTDADLWPDEAEVTAESDPLDPASTPALVNLRALPRVELVLPGRPQLGADAFGIMVAGPPILALLPVAPDFNASERGLTLAKPPVLALLPSAPQLADGDRGLTLARPPVQVSLPANPQFLVGDTGTTVARPPVTVRFPTN
jgi:hypothetical protein